MPCNDIDQRRNEEFAVRGPFTNSSSEHNENTAERKTKEDGGADAVSRPTTTMARCFDIMDDENVNLVSDAGTCSGDESDAQSSSSSSIVSACRSKKKRVTWAGLDDLDYVPTRTYPRKRPRRIKCKDAKKKSKKSGAKKEKIIAVRYLTGTLYTYKGPNPRVEFVRHY